MKTIILISAFLLSNITFSQNKNAKEYNIFLTFDSSKEEMIVVNKVINDTIYQKTFTISKEIPKEKQNHSLSVNQKGHLQIGVLGSLSWNNDGVLRLMYLTPVNESIQVLKVDSMNRIDFETFKNAKFTNFVDILKGASNVYVIDLAEENIESNFYNAYEVKF